MSRYSAAVLADSPALYWDLDATNGATDLSGNSRNGTGAGGISIGGFASSPISGETTSTNFDNIDDRITTTYNPFVNGVARTFCGWATRDTNSGFHVLVGGIDATRHPLLDLGSGTQTVRLIADLSSPTSVSWTNAWPGNAQWVHWALVFDESTDTVALYINGSLVSSQAYTATYNATPGNLQLGLRGAAAPFDGKMAGVAVFERALSAGTIKGYYELGSNPPVLRSACHRVPSAPLVGAYV